MSNNHAQRPIIRGVKGCLTYSAVGILLPLSRKASALTDGSFQVVIGCSLVKSSVRLSRGRTSPTMVSSNYAVDVPALLAKLTLKEKISLLSATDWWRTPVIERPGVFVPHIKVRHRSRREDHF